MHSIVWAHWPLTLISGICVGNSVVIHKRVVWFRLPDPNSLSSMSPLLCYCVLFHCLMNKLMVIVMMIRRDFQQSSSKLCSVVWSVLGSWWNRCARWTSEYVSMTRLLWRDLLTLTSPCRCLLPKMSTVLFLCHFCHCFCRRLSVCLSAGAWITKEVICLFSWHTVFRWCQFSIASYILRAVIQFKQWAWWLKLVTKFCSIVKNPVLSEI